MTEDEFAELAAGAALGALSAEDAERFARARAARPEWEPVAAAAEATAVHLADGIPPVAPPPAIREALLARIAEPPAADEPAPAPSATAGAGSGASQRRWTRSLFALAASVVVIAGLALGALQLSGAFVPASVRALDDIRASSDVQQSTVPLDGGGEATAYWSAERGQAVLVASGLPAVASDRTFELWYVADGAPVAAGTFDAADGRATALLDAPYAPGAAIAVTVEQDGGSPTGQPTTTPILAIPTA